MKFISLVIILAMLPPFTSAQNQVNGRTLRYQRTPSFAFER